MIWDTPLPTTGGAFSWVKILILSKENPVGTVNCSLSIKAIILRDTLFYSEHVHMNFEKEFD